MHGALAHEERRLAGVAAANAGRLATLVERLELELGLQALYAQLGRHLEPVSGSATLLTAAGLAHLLPQELLQPAPPPPPLVVAAVGARPLRPAAPPR